MISKHKVFISRKMYSNMKRNLFLFCTCPPRQKPKCYLPKNDRLGRFLRDYLLAGVRFGECARNATHREANPAKGNVNKRNPEKTIKLAISVTDIMTHSHKKRRRKHELQFLHFKYESNTPKRCYSIYYSLQSH